MTEAERIAAGHRVCQSCDGTGIDLWRGSLNPDGDMAECEVCSGRGVIPILKGDSRG